MHTHTVVFMIMTFLHDLFTAVWIGGLITLGFNLMPSMKRVLGRTPEMKKLMDAVQKRQSIFVTVSVIGLALTGLLLSKRSPAGGALLSFESTYAILLSVKHLLYLVMILLAVLRNIVSGKPVKPRQLEQAGQIAQPRQLMLAVQPQKNTAALLMFANAGVGVVVLLLSSILSVLSSSAG